MAKNEFRFSSLTFENKKVNIKYMKNEKGGGVIQINGDSGADLEVLNILKEANDKIINLLKSK